MKKFYNLGASASARYSKNIRSAYEEILRHKYVQIWQKKMYAFSVLRLISGFLFMYCEISKYMYGTCKSKCFEHQLSAKKA